MSGVQAICGMGTCMPPPQALRICLVKIKAFVKGRGKGNRGLRYQKLFGAKVPAAALEVLEADLVAPDPSSSQAFVSTRHNSVVVVRGARPNEFKIIKVRGSSATGRYVEYSRLGELIRDPSNWPRKYRVKFPTVLSNKQTPVATTPVSESVPLSKQVLSLYFDKDTVSARRAAEAIQAIERLSGVELSIIQTQSLPPPEDSPAKLNVTSTKPAVEAGG